MAGRKAASVKPAKGNKFTVQEYLALKQKADAGQASEGERLALVSALSGFRAKLAGGKLSERTARELGLAVM